MSGNVSAISPRRRIANAFAGEGSDRPPVFDVANNPRLFSQILGKDNHFSEPDLAVDLNRALGLDAVMIPGRSYSGMIRKDQDWLDGNRFIDRFGLEYAANDRSWPLGFVVKERVPDKDFLYDLEKQADDVDGEADLVRQAVLRGHNGGSDEIAVFGGLRSGFSFLNIANGLTALSFLIYENPRLLQRIVNAADEFWTRVGLELIQTGVDALYVANDMGMNGSTLISPEHLREFFLPGFFRQCRIWKDAGARVILHSCGNINAILPDLYESDCIDGINNLQTKSGMDIFDVKQKYGDRWTLIGNVDATTVMTSDDTALIDAALRDLLGQVGTEKLIIATDHSFHQGIPVSNVRHFIDAAVNLGLESQRAQP